MSKRVFEHPPEAETGRKYWRSLGQLSNTPEFQEWLHREFPQGAAELNGSEVSRRSFVQLMGASAALAGLSLAACRRPEKHLVPFTKGAEWSIPGKALFFATSMPSKQGFQPLVATTYDGRPTKIEGNPYHPASNGATCTFAQSSILDLYDPDRTRDFVSKGEASSAEEFEKALDGLISGAGDGGRVAILAESSCAPTRSKLRAEIQKKYPKLIWAEYEPTGSRAAEAAAVAFGPGMLAIPYLDKAKVIMAIDSDFLSATESSVEAIRQFSSRRTVSKEKQTMNRLYVIEPRYTVTGGMADHRLRVPASQAGAFLAAVGAVIAKATGDANLSGVLKALQAPAGNFNQDWVQESAADLLANKKESIVLVGGRQPISVQVLGYAINGALGNLGSTLVGRTAKDAPAKKIEDIAAAIDAKQIDTLFILGGNPVYNAPADLGWPQKQSQVKNVVRLGYYTDETSAHESKDAEVSWVVPQAHYLETWGDGYASDGSYTSVQPMILPLFGGWSELDLLAKLAGRPKPKGPELVQETFRETVGGTTDLTAPWSKFLHDGFLADSAAKPAALAFQASATLLPLPPIDTENFEVILAADSSVDDGRHANNGWLQELPDPICKLTWDNAAWMSPATAKQLGIEELDKFGTSLYGSKLIEITVGDVKVKAAAIVVPGTADHSITLTLGYGRKFAGRVAMGAGGLGTGFDAYPLLTTKTPYIVTGAKLALIGEDYQLGITQEHGTLEGRGADLTREAQLPLYKTVASAEPESELGQYFKKMGMDGHIPKNVSIYSHPPLNDIHAWGMTIDLNTCTGCSACMVACQAENNVPIVGKEQVINNREMHWLRMDRYFATEDGNFEDPEMLSQPMMCQHCENAPCETVCPVNATVHSEDGINVMAYNRCIGTRYCANNCPFKVRRFNFFDYNERNVLGHKPGTLFTGLYKWNLISERGMQETLKMQKNPNVTVRMRGVMEKCTFCIQRVQEAKIAAKIHDGDGVARSKDGKGAVGPRVPADAFTSACAQVCPAGAITFGDQNNPESSVSKLKTSERGYRLLEYLNLSTRVTYLARVRNPNQNPKMPDSGKLGNFIKSHSKSGEHPASANGGHA